jgi:hypothetical protein
MADTRPDAVKRFFVRELAHVLFPFQALAGVRALSNYLGTL